ncbi:MAG TPA: Xaa-Pro peptidase family protein [Acidobacteriota bacterium]|nr:Xaa-Pro peptidase family protein [Acidobacteriota bacterium]
MRNRRLTLFAFRASRAALAAVTAAVIFAQAVEVPAQAPTADPPPIGMEVFKARRQALMDSIGAGTAILYSQGRSGETGYHADANFWYLTGNDEGGAILVLQPGEYDREILLTPSRDTEDERWTGMRPALTESLKVAWGFDDIRRTGSLNGMLVNNMKHTPTLHLISPLVSPSSDVPKDLELYRKVSGRIPGVEIENSSHFLESMRMVKSDAEVAAIEKAIAVTHQGITDLLAAVRPGIYEYQLDGILEESFKRRGAQHMAFDPIVGAGVQTAILHYERRDQPLKEGQLLLLDVGAAWDHYRGDISRTVPVDGTFTPEQAEIYDIVLAALNAAIDAVKPGVTTRDVHEVARDVIRRSGYVDDFIHSTSHHLGLQTHDAADYGTPLAPGMVITIEPGIYLPDREIGVRIEDDVVVTKTGCRVLSAAIPRDRVAVEAWLAAARR